MSYNRRALITGLAATLLAPRRARAASVTDGASRAVLVPALVERVRFGWHISLAAAARCAFRLSRAASASGKGPALMGLGGGARVQSIPRRQIVHMALKIID